MVKLNVKTSKREELIDISGEITNKIPAGFDGICIVFIPHTTAGVTINENADPSVKSDMLGHLAALIPQSADFRHMEGNSDAHIKASLMGSSITIMVESGRLLLGTWQGIYFSEFDGPRNRKAFIKFIRNTD